MNGATNKPTSITSGPVIYSLEIGSTEDEIDSLMKETDGLIDERVLQPTSKVENLTLVLKQNFNLRQRSRFTSAARNAQQQKTNTTTSTGGMVTLLRSNLGNYSSLLRSFVILGGMAVLTVIFLQQLIGNYFLSANIASQSVKKTPHGPTLGGKLNAGHYNVPVVKDKNELLQFTTYDDDFYNSEIPSSSSSSSRFHTNTFPESISSNNIQNLQGHYLHDWFKSPYSSPYYTMNETQIRHDFQLDFEKRRDKYAQTYGFWHLSQLETNDMTKPTTDKKYPSISYKDIPELKQSDWPRDSWYLEEFLHEAKSLISRVKEGIYEEYGYGILNVSSTVAKGTILQKRLQYFQVQFDQEFTINDVGAACDNNNVPLPGIAYLTTGAWEGLIRKLLHSIMTKDQFYVVVAGSASTYRGNNMFQSQVMQFNYIMEPVLDKLGVQLISRNMGMDATTTLSAMAGADVYGETDIFWHIVDDNDEEKSKGQLDLLFKQAILSGERVPIILTPKPPKSLWQGTNSEIWIGNLQPGADFCEKTILQDELTIVPPLKACRYVNCAPDADCDHHSSVCWVDRLDVEPLTEQHPDIGHQDEGYLSDNAHRLEGRKLSMLILHALDEALDRWMEQSNAGVLPLPTEYWHVGPYYEKIRKRVRTETTSSSMGDSCESFVKGLDAPRLCRTAMHGFTEWTPRVTPNARSLKSVVTNQLCDNHATLLELYNGINLMPPQWMPSDDEVDVHMIAISTEIKNLEPGDKANELGIDPDNPFYLDDDDYDWVNQNDDVTNFGFEGDNNQRRRNQNMNHRKLLTHDVSSAACWTAFNLPVGFCDGSAQSTCNRIYSNKCLLANYNHYKAYLLGHGKSGKLRMTLPEIREGLILARFEWNLSDGPKIEDLPDDFVFEYTVFDKYSKTKTLTRSMFVTATVELSKEIQLHVLLNDSTQMSTEVGAYQSIDIEIEVQSVSKGTAPLVMLSHLYYA